MDFMIKSEEEIKNYLKQLSDEQIKKMIDGLDFSPFPILLTTEYEKRFGVVSKNKKNKKAALKSKIHQERKNQRKAINDLKLALRQIISTTVSTSGLESISSDGIRQIHKKTESATKNFLQSANYIAVSIKRISQLEQEYKSLD